MGDGPWVSTLHRLALGFGVRTRSEREGSRVLTFYDQLPQRQFDNFQFVSFQKVRHTATEESKVLAHRIQDDHAETPAEPCELDPRDLLFTLQILMEVPAQYEAMCKLNLL